MDAGVDEMFELAREHYAWGLVVLVVLIGTVWLVRYRICRKREALRRRGIKRYGH